VKVKGVGGMELLVFGFQVDGMINLKKKKINLKSQ
jgi:hypothetical protein